MTDVQSAKTIRSLVVRFKHTEQLLIWLPNLLQLAVCWIFQSLLMLSERAMQLCQAQQQLRDFSLRQPLQVLTSRRYRMTDDKLDRLLFLRSVRK